MTEIEWWEFESRAALAQQVAGDIGFVVESAIEAHGGARLALPDGSTLDLFCDALLAENVDWDKVTLLPTDDRLVAAADPLSNFGGLEARFGSTGATLIPLIDDGALGDYREAGRLADERLAKLDWPLDLVCLGVGEEGQTASILPGPDLERAIAGPRGRRAIGVHPDPMRSDAPVDRVTLTADSLVTARAVMIVIVGPRVREVLERAVDEGPLSQAPIGRLLAELDIAVDVFWTAQ